MNLLIEKYINKESIDRVRTALNMDNETYEEFIRFVTEIIQQDIELNHTVSDTEKSYEDEVLEHAANYIKEYIKHRSKGFSHLWSQSYGFNDFFEDGYKSLAVAYSTVKHSDKEQALIDIELYSRLNNKHALFPKIFTYLASIDSVLIPDSIEELTDEFIGYYKQQIEIGQGEVYALKYADLMTNTELDELRFKIEATEYEKAILAGHSKVYAYAYAEELASTLSILFCTYEDASTHRIAQLKRVEIEKKFNHLK